MIVSPSKKVAVGNMVMIQDDSGKVTYMTPADAQKIGAEIAEFGEMAEMLDKLSFESIQQVRKAEAPEDAPAQVEEFDGLRVADKRRVTPEA